MNIAVCLKFDLDARDVKIQDDGTIDMDDARIVLTEDDARALGAAKSLAKSSSSSIIAVCVSQHDTVPSQLFREVLARGAEALYVIVDKRIGTADENAIADVFATALEKIGVFDLIICGAGSGDCNMQQVCFRLGTLMNATAINEVESFVFESDGLHAERWLEGEVQKLVIPLPASCSTTSFAAELTAPGLMDLAGASKKPVVVWNLDDMGMTEVAASSIRTVSISGKGEQTQTEEEMFFPVLTMLKMLRSENKSSRRRVMLPSDPTAAAIDLVDILIRESAL